MKRIVSLIVLSLGIFSFSSCSTNDVKEISGTIVLRDQGSHVFNINADNIEATITIAAPNSGETLVYEKVPMYRTSDYHARIGMEESTGQLKTELRNNLVVMYELEIKKSIEEEQQFADAGYIKIDWKGIN